MEQGDKWIKQGIVAEVCYTGVYFLKFIKGCSGNAFSESSLLNLEQEAKFNKWKPYIECTLKLGDKFKSSKKGTKATVVYRDSNYSLETTVGIYRGTKNTLKELEVLIHSNGWTKVIEELPTVKVGDKFLGSEVVKVVAYGDVLATHWVSYDNIHLNPCVAYKDANNLLKRLIELEFTKIEEKEMIETKIEIRHTKPELLYPMNDGTVYTKETAHSSREVIVISRGTVIYLLDVMRMSIIPDIGLSVNEVKTHLQNSGYKLFKGEIKITQ